MKKPKTIRKVLMRVANSLLKQFGKRITNYDAAAKPFSNGVFFLKKFLPAPANIIDVGTADGTSELTDAFPFGTCRYLLIDPMPTFASYLDGVKSQFPDTVFIEKCFCGETEGSVRMHVNKKGAHNGHYASRYVDTDSKETVEVPMKTLDQLNAKHKLIGPTILKIDVEGAELDVLKGATETLKICDFVIIENWINVPHLNVDAKSFASVVSYMSQQSFVVFDFFGGHTNDSGTLCMVDTVFTKVDSPHRTI